MAYNKRVWKDDDLITPEDMNRIETGISDNSSSVSSLSPLIGSESDSIKSAISDSESTIVGRINLLSTENENSFSEVLTSLNDKHSDISDKLSEVSSGVSTVSREVSALNTGVSTKLDSISSKLESLTPSESGEIISNWQRNLQELVERTHENTVVINDRASEIEDETTRVKDKMDSALSQMGAIGEIKTGISDLSDRVISEFSNINSRLDSASNTETIANSIAEVSESQSRLLNTIDSQSESLSVMEGNVTSILNKLNTPPEDMPADLKGSLDAINSKVSNVGSAVSSVKSVCDEIKETVFQPQGGVDDSKLDSIKSSISDLTSLVTSLSSSLSYLDGKVNSLSNRVYSIWESKLTSINPSEFTTYNEPGVDVLINTNTPLSTITNITAKSIEIEKLAMESTRLVLAAENAVSISNFSSNGDLAKAVSNAAVSINTNDNVSIMDSNIGQTGYNSIEIGLSNTAPKSVTIQNVNFNSAMSNNAILIFAHQPHADITIRDCYFKSVSNALRISNRTNVPATIYMMNCRIDKWDSDPNWAGAIIFEDYTSKTAEECRANDLFNKNKLKFIISNVYGPDGNKITADDLTRSDAQGHFAYIWNNNEGAVSYTDNPDRYPTFIFA